MGRGKLKYRDVVGGRKIKSSNQKKYGKQKNQRKPYSLHQSQGGAHGVKKQGPHKKRPRYEEQLDESKRFKYEKPAEAEPESEESEEEDDPATKLLALLDPNFKKSLEVQKMKRKVAIESDFESSDNDDEQDTNKEASVGADESSDGQSDNEDDDGKLVEDETADTATEIDDVNNDHDPFVRHLFYNLHEKLLEAAQAKQYETHHQTWPKLGNVCTKLVKPTGEMVNTRTKILDRIQKFALVGTVPLQPSTPINLQKLFVKTQIRDHLRKANVVLEPDSKEVLTPLQSELFAIMNNYQDFMYNERTFDNAEEIRYAYCLHAVNHIMKTRTKILHHNARLSDKSDVPPEFRDQGVVRPKILILLPFRDAAYRVIRMITEILLKEDKGNVIKKDRFIKEFTGNEITFPKVNVKPDDYVKTFSGNCSDDFRIGMTVTKKSLKLYADFYSSDIIVASTLGLRTIIGAEGESHRDFDFLASIELLILDQAEIFLMQNFDHLLHIMNHVHLKPEKRHNTDFSRLRHWSINGWEKYYRQTLIFSSVPSPYLNIIFSRYCHNYAGKVETINPVAAGQADRISRDVRKHPQYFLKFQASSSVACIQERFDFFINNVLPELREAQMKPTLIYVPDEYDLVRLRGYFFREGLSFARICDSTEEGKVAMARNQFFHGEVDFLLYSERFHFFKRMKIKGIRHLVFYEPPTFPHFYTEMCNLMLEENMNKRVGDSYMTIRVIYCKFDGIPLDGIVGSAEAARMIESEKSLHCTHKI